MNLRRLRGRLLVGATMFLLLGVGASVRAANMAYADDDAGQNPLAADEQNSSPEQKNDPDAISTPENASTHTVIFIVGQDSTTLKEVHVPDGQAVADPGYKESGIFDDANKPYYNDHHFDFVGWRIGDQTEFAEASDITKDLYDFKKPVSGDLKLSAVYAFDQHKVYMNVLFNPYVPFSSDLRGDPDPYEVTPISILSGKTMKEALDNQHECGDFFTLGINSKSSVMMEPGMPHPGNPKYIFNGWFDQYGHQYTKDTPIDKDVHLLTSWRLKGANTNVNILFGSAEILQVDGILHGPNVPDGAKIVLNCPIPSASEYDKLPFNFTDGCLCSISPKLFVNGKEIHNGFGSFKLSCAITLDEYKGANAFDVFSIHMDGTVTSERKPITNNIASLQISDLSDVTSMFWVVVKAPNGGNDDSGDGAGGGTTNDDNSKSDDSQNNNPDQVQNDTTEEGPIPGTGDGNSPAIAGALAGLGSVFAAGGYICRRNS
ncbi:hypothetical protein Corgl_1431 [Coriobacterium glomerans PW2]|uniref:LPXTG-motif cell wall anchor domain protein n=1 Tax=Coriobacterium glomerans (strain ATCC 49209 / DSM 20642 / JCM 10262 / PW2) TaxID=700015 RepID=F2NAS5_CORGP|nr:hypothetical protein [Coriobacterium glomerans]AEB07531.1 hypothetical protein Corgl_1431 [Coriobacterium glomerans PW2]